MSNQINLDISNKCTLACSFCERQSESFDKKIFKDMTLNEFKFVANNYEVFFCGQVSDPIYNKNFREMLEYLYKKNKNTSVHTAAYRNNIDYYTKLFEAHPKAVWVFGIDGLPLKSHKHRVNQKGNNLFKVMLHARKMNINTIWQIILFDFNKNDLDECKIIANNYDIKLRIINSNRNKQNLVSSELVPQCLKGKELGYSAMGYIMPCCWLAEGNVENKYPSLCNETTKVDKYNVNEINKSIEQFKLLLKNNPQNAPLKCWQKCSSKSTSKIYINT